MEKRSQRDFGRKFKLVHLIIVALVVMAATAAATYLITTGGFGAQKYFEDAKAYVAETYGGSLLKIGKIEEQFAAAAKEIEADLDKVNASITVE